jgi:hypothetical protein
MTHSFLDASIEDIINQLSQDEKILLLSGSDFWR